jgi:GxxExxY protein
MTLSAIELNGLSEKAIGCAIRVHRNVGPGLLESAYRQCYAYELSQEGLRFVTEYPLSLAYGPVKLDCGYRIDFLIERSLIIEVKSVQGLAPIHVAQMLTYLRLADCRLGLIMNFNVKLLPSGIKRVVDRFPEDSASSAGSAVNLVANP